MVLHWQKNYNELYFYAEKGAKKAKNVYPFKIGDSTKTASYENWTPKFLDFVLENNLRLDFISWYNYLKNPEDFNDNMIALNKYLAYPKYNQFQNLEKIISEWGYYFNHNTISDSNLEAAYTIKAIRNFIEADYKLVFLSEIKESINPSLGIITKDGKPKAHYYALKLININDLSGMRLLVEGEGTYVSTLASLSYNHISLVLFNYDPEEKNTEMVPILIKNLSDGEYYLKKTNLLLQETQEKIIVKNNEFKINILMTPNSVWSIKLEKINE